MNSQQVFDLVQQYQTEQRHLAAQQRLSRREYREQLLPRVAREQSLRSKTGWTLVHLGLRLAVPAGRRAAVTPGAVRS